MTLAAPFLAITGLLAVSVPVILHFLFRRRHQPIAWAAMDLLRIAITRTSHRRKIEKLLLLLLRSVIVVVAGVAIAGPLLNNTTIDANSPHTTPREVVLVVDDGVSQQTNDNNGEAFLNSRAQALGAINTLTQGDLIGIILAAGAQPLVWPPSNDIAAARTTLETTSVSNTPTDFTAAIELARGHTQTIGVLSAFRSGSISSVAQSSHDDSSYELILTPPTQDDVTNVQLISCEVQARNPSSRAGVPLRLQLTREGDLLTHATSNIDISLDNGSRTALRFDWKPGQADATIETVIDVTTRQQAGVPLRATLSDHDAQQADNHRFAVVSTSHEIRVGVVDRDTASTDTQEQSVRAWIDRALAPTPDGDIDTETIDPTSIDQQRCGGLDAIIVIRPDLVDATGWNILNQMIGVGKVLIVIPPSQPSRGSWSDGFLRAIDLGWSIAQEPTHSDPPLTITHTESTQTLLGQLTPELQDLTQPITISRWFNITTPAGRSENVLTLSGGSPFITYGSPEGARGSVVLFAAPPNLSWTNLPAKPLMVPLFQECVRQSTTQAHQLPSVTVGSSLIATSSPSPTTLRLIMGSPGESTEDVRQIHVDPQGSLASPLTTPGVYANTEATGKIVGLVVANIDPQAASTKRTTIDEVKSQFKNTHINTSTTDFSSGITSTSHRANTPPVAKALNGYSLAPWFFGFVIALTLVETWMARHTTVRSTTNQSVSHPQ